MFVGGLALELLLGGVEFVERVLKLAQRLLLGGFGVGALDDLLQPVGRLGHQLAGFLHLLGCLFFGSALLGIHVRQTLGKRPHLDSSGDAQRHRHGAGLNGANLDVAEGAAARLAIFFVELIALGRLLLQFVGVFGFIGVGLVLAVHLFGDVDFDAIVGIFFDL